MVIPQPLTSVHLQHKALPVHKAPLVLKVLLEPMDKMEQTVLKALLVPPEQMV